MTNAFYIIPLWFSILMSGRQSVATEGSYWGDTRTIGGRIAVCSYAYDKMQFKYQIDSAMAVTPDSFHLESLPIDSFSVK